MGSTEIQVFFFLLQVLAEVGAAAVRAPELRVVRAVDMETALLQPQHREPPVREQLVGLVGMVAAAVGQTTLLLLVVAAGRIQLAVMQLPLNQETVVTVYRHQ
jgi:hypothetical protein